MRIIKAVRRKNFICQPVARQINKKFRMFRKKCFILKKNEDSGTSSRLSCCARKARSSDL